MNVGGVIPAAYLDDLTSRAAVRMTFGETSFLGLAPISTSSAPHGHQAAWWSTYTGECSPEMRKTTNRPSDPVLRSLMRERHGRWADPTIQLIVADLVDDGRYDASARVEKVTIDLHTPTWVVPKLPQWSRGRFVLVGDAAHALPSASGQGVSQAFGDAAALSLFLAGAVKRASESKVLSNEGLAQVMTRYKCLRKLRVERILDEALQMQVNKKKMGWLEETIMICILWALIRFGGGK